MKRILIATIVLSGCMTTAQQTLKSEQEVWAAASLLAYRQCGGVETEAEYEKSYTRKNAKGREECEMETIEGMVLPYSVDKLAFLEMMKEIKRKNSAYTQGKLSKEDWLLDRRIALAKYEGKVINTLAAAHAVQLQKRQDAAQAFSQSMQAQQAINAQNQANAWKAYQSTRPINTNCNQFGNQINCTSY